VVITAVIVPFSEFSFPVEPPRLFRGAIFFHQEELTIRTEPILVAYFRATSATGHNLQLC